MSFKIGDKVRIKKLPGDDVPVCSRIVPVEERCASCPVFNGEIFEIIEEKDVTGNILLKGHKPNCLSGNRISLRKFQIQKVFEWVLMKKGS